MPQGTETAPVLFEASKDVDIAVTLKKYISQILLTSDQFKKIRICIIFVLFF
jgi:hypothetical protein